MQSAMTASPMIGLSYRGPLAGWIEHESAVECVEITAEHFFDRRPQDIAHLERFAAQWPVSVHGLGLSLGTPGQIPEEILARFVEVARRARARWVSEHIAFTKAGGIDLGHLNPVPRTPAMLEVLAEHVTVLRERCGVPVLLENITTHFDPGGVWPENEFLNRLCERSGCRLLLDVTNLWINAHNHHFDPRAWLLGLAPEHIGQIHVVGYAERNGRLHDTHEAPVQPDLLKFLGEVLESLPVEAVFLERDENLTDKTSISAELGRLRSIRDQVWANSPKGGSIPA